MRKQQYIFLILICIILYLLYLIVDHKYKEYKINNHIDIIENNNNNISNKIKDYKEQIEYKNTNAYKNKILKEEGSMKNTREEVIFITNEQKYNKFSKDSYDSNLILNIPEREIQDGMEIYEKWIYFLFKKDIR